MDAVNAYSKKVIEDLSGDDHKAIMNGVLAEYAQFNQTGTKASVLTGSGITINYNADGVRREMIKLVTEFSKSNLIDQARWIGEIQQGGRLSSGSFQPIIRIGF